MDELLFGHNDNNSLFILSQQTDFSFEDIGLSDNVGCSQENEKTLSENLSMINDFDNEIENNGVENMNILTKGKLRLTDSDDYKDEIAPLKERVNIDNINANIISDSHDNSNYQINDEWPKVDFNTIPAKRNTKTYEKDRLRLLVDNQRIIRENETIDFKYMPKRCRTINEMKELLNKKNINQKEERRDGLETSLDNDKSNECINEIIEESMPQQAVNRDNIVPLRDRIHIDKTTRMTIDSYTISKSTNMSVRRSIEDILKEKYYNCPVVTLKSKEQYAAENKSLEKFKSLLMSKEPKIDIYTEESCNITLPKNSKCVKIAGKIDPILSKGIESLLSEEDRKEWIGMSARARWNKHRSLLLSAQAEKTREAREERLNLLKMTDCEKDKDREKTGQGQTNDGLSDDDYEWRAGDKDGGSNDDSDSDTDRGPFNDNEQMIEGSDNEDDIVSQKRKKKSIKRIIDSDNEDESECVEDSLNVSTEQSPKINNKFPFIDEEINFFDIPNLNSTSEDLFLDSQSVINLDESIDITGTVDESFEEDRRDSLGLKTSSINNKIELIEDVTLTLNNYSNLKVGHDEISSTQVIPMFSLQSGDYNKNVDKTLSLQDDPLSYAPSLTCSLPDDELSGCTSILSSSSSRLHSYRNKLFNLSLSDSTNVALDIVSEEKCLIKDIEDEDLEVDLDADNEDKIEQVDSDNNNEDDDTSTDSDDDDSCSDDSSNETTTYQSNRDTEIEEDDEEEQLRRVVMGVTDNFIHKEYFDEEAELSGSDADEFGPDEDETGMDKYEAEEGDKEKLPSEGKLRRQIGKIHNRIEIDKDAQDIRYLKELYLEDGDLDGGEDGPRKKRFTWIGINEDPITDTLLSRQTNDDDDEEEEEENNGDEEDRIGIAFSQTNTCTEEEQDETTNHLMEKYGKLLHHQQWRPINNYNNATQLAWHIQDDAITNNGTKIQEQTTSTTIRKYGSFINKSSTNVTKQLPINISKLDHNSALKSRMQQHTFAVHCSDNTNILKRSSTNNNNNDFIAKKRKQQNSS